ncbi:MAG: putative DNA binding domain-containing protein [Actinobacteria bacterium]|nr:putative DNA binding domain-containing protein [Actinomycetota bacterium]
MELQELESLLADGEDERLDFKEARTHFDFEKLVDYCVAFANEGGGRLILGVTDAKPHQVVGTTAFQEPARTAAGIMERLHLKVEVERVMHPNGAVLVVTVPGRPIGVPIHYRGTYWMRAGDSLVPMTPDQIKKILDEAQPDFSAQMVPNGTLHDLDPTAIALLRGAWRRKSGNENIANSDDEQLLSDLELVVEGKVTYAALVLVGASQGLNRHLPQAEVIFEYRSREESLPYQQRKEYRQGFLTYQADLWDTVNLRNEVHQYQEGLFMREIPTFNESVVREAILNAVCHRDYRFPESIFIRQFPSKLEIISPGGFPPGVDAENILWRQSPRNRRIAEVLAKCGFVERSGQGANRMYEESVRESKPLPDYSGTDDFQVFLTISGEVQDAQFLRFLEEVGSQTLSSFNTVDLLVLSLVYQEKPIPPKFQDRLPRLCNLGLVERIGRGKGTKYILGRKFHQYLGRGGTYTRRRGLDRETNKELLLRHIRDSRRTGADFGSLQEVLPALSRGQIKTLLSELKRDGRIQVVGRTRSARWFPGDHKSASS